MVNIIDLDKQTKPLRETKILTSILIEKKYLDELKSRNIGFTIFVKAALKETFPEL